MIEKKTDWVLALKRVTAIVGHYGSGKTELSINIALELAHRKLPVTLVDLDIVNPFFRSAECSDMLKAHGIRPLYSDLALSAADIPTLPAGLSALLEDDSVHVILDVGGDAAGANALGGFKRQLEQAAADMLLVVNPFRPRSSTREQIMGYIDSISKSARYNLTGIIINSNLANETTTDNILMGRSLMESISRECNIPIVAEAGISRVIDKIESPYNILPIERYLKPEWMEL